MPKNQITLNELMDAISKIKIIKNLPYEIEKFIVLCKEKKLGTMKTLEYLKKLGHELTKNQLDNYYRRNIKGDISKYEKILNELKKEGRI